MLIVEAGGDAVRNPVDKPKKPSEPKGGDEAEQTRRRAGHKLRHSRTAAGTRGWKSFH